jgi:tetratricopeptide (TPR) repeat protein
LTRHVGGGQNHWQILVLSFAPLNFVRASALAFGLLVSGAARAADPAGPLTAEPNGLSDTDTRVAVAEALGDRLFKLGRYEDAVAEYRRAYELRADPGFLFHIAECYRELGATEQALFYYERFLAAKPDAPERDEVLDKITELENPRARGHGARPKMVLVPEDTAPKTPPSVRPWHKWWFWTALGVVVSGGVTAAVLTGRSQSSIPGSDLGDKRFY